MLDELIDADHFSLSAWYESALLCLFRSLQKYGKCCCKNLHFYFAILCILGLQKTVSGKTETIKVWLSDAGIKKYESQIHLRPSFSSIDDCDNHIYIFECTEMQALYYFFSFGKDAKVISPDSLSTRFKKNYAEAISQYE